MIYIYIYIFQKHLHLCKISVLNILTKYMKDTMKFIFSEYVSWEPAIILQLNFFTGISSFTLLQFYASSYDLLEIKRTAFSRATLDVFLKIWFFVLGLREISLNKAKEYELLGINLIPGKKLCVSCRKSIAKQSKSDDALRELEQIDSDPDYVNDNTDVNSQLENIGISPISNHAKAKLTRISTGKRKLSQINFRSAYQESWIFHVKKYLNKILLLIIIVLIARTVNNF